MPIRDLPVSLIFDDIDDFKIMTITHDTIPKYEFGYINETRWNTSIRFVFSLLNPEDEDTITIVANELACLNLYAKSEGVSIKISTDSQTNMTEFEEIVPIFAVLISILAIGFMPLSRKIQVSLYDIISKISKILRDK